MDHGTVTTVGMKWVVMAKNASRLGRVEDRFWEGGDVVVLKHLVCQNICWYLVPWL